jgi:polyphosphate kinase 2 (PPK2 family)
MPLTVDPRHVPALADAEAAPPADLPKGEALAEATQALVARVGAAQALLAAEATRAVLVVLQGRDTSGRTAPSGAPSRSAARSGCA